MPIDRTLAALLSALAPIAPQELLDLLRAQIAELSEGKHGSLLTFAILGAIWSSSAAMVAIIDALNRACDVREWRSWWKRRVVAIGLTVGLCGFIIAALVFVLAAPDVVAWAAPFVGSHLMSSGCGASYGGRSFSSW